MAYANFPKGCRIGDSGAGAGCLICLPGNVKVGRQMRRWLDRNDRKARRRAGLSLVNRKNYRNQGGNHV